MVLKNGMGQEEVSTLNFMGPVKLWAGNKEMGIVSLDQEDFVEGCGDLLCHHYMIFVGVGGFTCCAWRVSVGAWSFDNFLNVFHYQNLLGMILR